MNKLRLLGAVHACVAFVSLSANAETIIPSDYMIAGSIGDTWAYEKLDSTQFTWTLSEVASGTNVGRLERGNIDSGMVYDLIDNVLTVYEWNKIPFDPPLVFSEIELGQVVTLNDDPDNPSMYLFWDIPSITVQAGTFTDVLALVWLDGETDANDANTQLGLDPQVTAGVTDIDYFARGAGQVAFVGIEANDGTSDGTGNELVSTTVSAAINFSGQLDVIDVDAGGAVYSGVTTSTNFSGNIDAVTANGSISDGTTATSFGCCIAAGGFSITNNEVLDADSAAFLNSIIGSSIFSAGDVIDTVDIEGDATTAGGGRIEVGLNYILDGKAFANTDSSNYPFIQDDLLLALFFIVEEDNKGDTIFDAVGQLDAVPTPAVTYKAMPWLPLLLE